MILRPSRPAEASQSRSYPGKQGAAAAAAVVPGLLLLPSRHSLWRPLPSSVHCCTCCARRCRCGTLLLPGRGMQGGVARGHAPCTAAAAKSHPPEELSKLTRAGCSACGCVERSIAAASETPAKSQPQIHKASVTPFCPRRSSKQRVSHWVQQMTHYCCGDTQDSSTQQALTAMWPTARHTCAQHREIRAMVQMKREICMRGSATHFSNGYPLAVRAFQTWQGASVG